MSFEVILAVGTIVANAAATWAVVTVKLDWMRADITRIERRCNERTSCAPTHHR